MPLSIAALAGGLLLLIWSANRFVDAAAAVARYAGMPPLLIGMVIVGFGTSAPEMVVSAMAAADGNPALALGNGYGSNICNIGLIIGVAALISPIAVHSTAVRKEIPLLLAVTLFAGWQLLDGSLTRWDAAGLFVVFAGLMGWSIYSARSQRDDAYGSEVAAELDAHPMTLRRALVWLVAGLLLLVAASRIFVWGAVNIAHGLGVSDLVIGLTVVAVGTSLPELASAIASSAKGEHDLALGNVVGSNLFNTLLVVGIAAGISPLAVPPEVLTRDWPVMFGFTAALLLMGFGRHGGGRIGRIEAALLLVAFCAYTGWLIDHARTATG